MSSLISDTNGGVAVDEKSSSGSDRMSTTFVPFSAGRQSHLCVAGSPMKLVNTRPLCLDVHSCPAK